ncbi:hypothetical protein EYF80_038257 [Liparis tanakae]|uniref:Uncharacterized protein n=1 Tax=Liparis tanakae TaxID=230148 RepID=A0A4Z2GD59_9TELE|nr:hypothetical protein EYF80_038257 [Liparis tanakae]
MSKVNGTRIKNQDPRICVTLLRPVLSHPWDVVGAVASGGQRSRSLRCHDVRRVDGNPGRDPRDLGGGLVVMASGLFCRCRRRCGRFVRRAHGRENHHLWIQ